MPDDIFVIRAMANSLYDGDLDPVCHEDIELITRLLCAGWSSKDLVRLYEPAKSMAAARFANDRRHRA